MTHSNLVQTATDMMAESVNPMGWLADYDNALASSSDSELLNFVQAIRAETAFRGRAAA